MNFRLIIYILGSALWVLAAFLLLPLAVSLIYGDGCWMAFAATVALCLVVGCVRCFFPGRKQRMQSREGYIAVAAAWMLLSVLSAVPYVLSGAIPHVADAVFEAASGLTTTGATVLTDVEAMPPSILLWRSETQWLGGVGVLVLFLALLSRTGSGAQFLLQAESPGPIKSKLVPKLSDMAKILYTIYVTLTALEFVCLCLAGMSVFDAINHAFTTVATGGFSTKNAGLAYYSDPGIHFVITAFTFLAGVNFAMIFLLFRGRLRDVWHSEELRAYVGIIGGGVAVCTLSLWLQRGVALPEAFRSSVFEVISVITTTGFANMDMSAWPTVCSLVLLGCMLVGACAGSTAGGIKISRVMLLRRSMRREMDKLVHPNRVDVITIDDHAITEKEVSAAHAYLVAFCTTVIFGAFVVALEDVGLYQSLLTSLMCISNGGTIPGEPAMDAVFRSMSTLSKCAMAFIMVMGRLELMPILVLISRRTWRHK